VSHKNEWKDIKRDNKFLELVFSGLKKSNKFIKCFPISRLSSNMNSRMNSFTPKNLTPPTKDQKHLNNAFYGNHFIFNASFTFILFFFFIGNQSNCEAVYWERYAKYNISCFLLAIHCFTTHSVFYLRKIYFFLIFVKIVGNFRFFWVIFTMYIRNLYKSESSNNFLQF
jgi:hypothetical protein